jgi:hypothetical protein
LPVDRAAIMQVIKGLKNSNLAIPVDRIDWINWEDGAKGRYIIKIGTGGATHILDCDNKEELIAAYDGIIKFIEEL